MFVNGKSDEINLYSSQGSKFRIWGFQNYSFGKL